MEHILIQWGSLLATKREQLKITQKELAELTQLSDLTIRNIERGKGGVAFANWIKVSDQLGYDFNLSLKKISDESRKSI
jgi:transcriptional regulator with XRE-family HTH domain